MACAPTAAFDSLAQRVIYGLRLMYSEFAPATGTNASEKAQAKLHTLLGAMIDALYAKPSLLNLPAHPDEAFQLYELNNAKPELDKAFQAVCKELYGFYKCLYITALHGEITPQGLSVGNAALKEYKTTCKPPYQTLLAEVGLKLTKNKAGVVLTADSELLHALKLLAEQVPVNVNKWTPFVLANFAGCSFTNDFGHLLPRADAASQSDGLLLQLQSRCLAEGYTQTVQCTLSLTNIEYNICFRTQIGGFHIVYSARKRRLVHFGTLNGIGEKAMLADFANLSADLQAHFIRICAPCSHCLGCTKGGRNTVFAVDVAYEGNAYRLCPVFPQHDWEDADRPLLEVLIKYHAAQERYGTDWKTK